MSRKPDITLAQLRYFIEAGEHLSMTTAAHELHIAQSAVSSAISQLESQVGAQLFIRQRSKGLALTEAGKQLLGDARGVLVQLDEALDAARGQDNQVRGRLRIACFVTLAPFVLPALITAIQDAHPHLEVEVDEVDFAGARDALRSGRAELAIGYNFGVGDDITAKVIAEVMPHIILPAGHPLAQRSRIPLRELSRERMILLDLPHSREYMLSLLTGAGVEPSIRYRSASYETVRSLVAQGHGFSILNQRPRHDTTYGGMSVAVRPIADDVPSLPIVLTTLRSARPSARARAIGALLERILREGESGRDPERASSTDASVTGV